MLKGDQKQRGPVQMLHQVQNQIQLVLLRVLDMMDLNLNMVNKITPKNVAFDALKELRRVLDFHLPNARVNKCKLKLQTKNLPD